MRQMYANDPTGIETRFHMTGVHYGSILAISEGAETLVSGSTFSEEQIKDGSFVIMIHRKLAESNGLKVGDEVLFEQSWSTPAILSMLTGIILFKRYISMPLKSLESTTAQRCPCRLIYRIGVIPKPSWKSTPSTKSTPPTESYKSCS